MLCSIAQWRKRVYTRFMDELRERIIDLELALVDLVINITPDRHHRTEYDACIYCEADSYVDEQTREWVYPHAPECPVARARTLLTTPLLIR